MSASNRFIITQCGVIGCCYFGLASFAVKRGSLGKFLARQLLKNVYNYF
jgi:hypothetical protein